MHLSFSENGPKFPTELVDALLDGDVVFLCGAGISSPQLPSFEKLVLDCFEQLHTPMIPAEQTAFDESRYEEALGSLRRRLSDQREMACLVAKLCTPSRKKPELRQHKTILRLSRNRENKPVIVTTNFDNMLELAYRSTVDDVGAVLKVSLAGQGLPAPGGEDFSGIIHIHGRIADEKLALAETPLVLTSADYGDAYMRSGWASRFLFDLCRCKTIVLVGYRAGDAPVRYFLNVLEADRERFKDLKPVYALDAAAPDGSASVGWEALGVNAITYRKKGDGSHSALWEDLDQLANLVERPRLSRRTMAQTILSKPLSEANDADLLKVQWLLKGGQDLLSVVIKNVKDEAWLSYIRQESLLSEADAAWVVASWVAHDFASVERFNVARRWSLILKAPFIEKLRQRLDSATELTSFWTHAYRLLSSLRFLDDADMAVFKLLPRLKGKRVLRSDIEDAVRLLTPLLNLDDSLEVVYKKRKVEKATSFNDVATPRLHLDKSHQFKELMEALVAYSKPEEVLAAASAKFHETVGLAVDAGITTSSYDRANADVPSVEPHQQNEYYDGLVLLAELLGRVLPQAVKSNRQMANAAVQSWASAPGLLGPRLALHAYLDERLYTDDAAIVHVASVEPDVFWLTKREIARLVRARAGKAKQASVEKLERRILVEGSAFYSKYAVEDGQVDWRLQARDSAVWLRLNMLAEAGRLSVAGQDELVAITGRRNYLNRKVEESDFFDSFSSGVEYVRADPTPMLEASDSDRLAKAHESRRSFDPDTQQGWSAYCRTDAAGALRTLAQAEMDAANAPLWVSLLSALSFPDTSKSSVQPGEMHEALTKVSSGTDEFLAIIIRSVVELFSNIPRPRPPTLTALWPRLFSVASTQELAPSAKSERLFVDAKNSAVGKLTWELLLDMEANVNAGKGLSPTMHSWLNTTLEVPGTAGLYVRTVLAGTSSFVAAHCGKKFSAGLKSFFGGDGEEAQALRAVLALERQHAPAAYLEYGEFILQGVVEVSSDNGAQRESAASKLLYPLIGTLRGDTKAEDWGIEKGAIAAALRTSIPGIRAAAASLLARWILELSQAPDEAWRQIVRPLLLDVWPKERALRDRAQTRSFAELAVKAGDAFPDALEVLKPYLTPLQRFDGVSHLETSDVPKKYPSETLELLWKLYGGSNADMVRIPQVLQTLAEAMPALEVDRRMQWLDRKALRYD